ncbi:CDP-alcohol phosphatidyltransferase family protein [Micromonospora peucetia]|uniref:CDP-alcohol phosphatidyltransferase family protein n=1 Tax=Micromonospora peucetia TaxID=47871 RepID=A0ABZ1ECG6_9ACTN|nr:CDP-alcohol phosphatidyltransferase family protein [Micromonospora peucetia]WSA31489.1 CDP-alcohol phosphatidyltransferase family protein [Micromonospora peucetia]
MPTVRTGPVIGLIVQIVLLAGLAATVGLGPAGWLAGSAYGTVLCLALDRGLRRSGGDVLGPADRVTLARAVLVGGVTALTVDALAPAAGDRPGPVGVLVALAAVALALDAADGYVARRTGTASALGARFDMEVDAFLILVLGLAVAPAVGAWVLALGAMRYAFVAAGWLLPWLRRPLPPRYWRKVVAAAQGVLLLVAAAGVLPGPGDALVLAVALALLVESFGRDVGWLWRHRPAREVPRHRPRGSRRSAPTSSPPVTDRPSPPRGRTREGASGRPSGQLVVLGDNPPGPHAARATTALAALLVLAALTAPHQPARLTPGAFVRVPLEGLLVVALLLALPAPARRPVAALAGALLGLLTLLKVADLGFLATLGRPFDPVLDWALLDDAVWFLTDSVGRAGATGTVVAAVLLLAALVLATTRSVLRLTRPLVRHRVATRRTVAVLVVVWLACATFGVRVSPGVPVADAAATDLVGAHASQVRARLRDREVFAAQIGVDPFRDTPGDRLLTGLRGKDVVVAFVESYGRDAVEDPEYAQGVGAVLADGDRRLRAAGFASRSGFLTSPTTGGGSWLAHATLLSGMWVDNDQRHRSLLSSDRLTLGGAFRRAGWRTIGVMPAVTRPWPEGAFFGYERFYDGRGLGYRGPRFGYAPMPDQYTLASFERLERSRADRAPAMAEIALVSSHSPWTRIPRLVDWSQVGDGSIFHHATTGNPSSQPRAGYRRCVEYSLGTLVSYLETHGDDDLVLVFLGDHQPAPVVTGAGAGRDVPVTVVARDPAVLDRISGWGWDDGLRPGPRAPVWPMDAFRDRFLTAFSG